MDKDLNYSERIAMMKAYTSRIEELRHEMPGSNFAEIFAAIGCDQHVRYLSLLANMMGGAKYPQANGTELSDGAVNDGYSFRDHSAALIVLTPGQASIHTFNTLDQVLDGKSNEMLKEEKRQFRL